MPFAARLLGRPVKWIEDRREHLLGDRAMRANADCDVEIACRSDGTILGDARPGLVSISAPISARTA